MSSVASDIRNYIKLQLLLLRSNVLLCQLFKKRFSQFNPGQLWDDTPTYGNNYLTNIFTKKKQICLTEIQKTVISNGNSNVWDLTILTDLLIHGERPKTLNTVEIKQLNHEDKLLKKLKDIRNELTHGRKSIPDAEFNRLWAHLAIILVEFGDVDTELNKLKDDSMFDSRNQLINEENVKEASRFNSLGVKAHKDRNFSEAITFFTKATDLPGVSYHDRAIIFVNMSSSRLALYKEHTSASSRFYIDNLIDEQYRALQDAQQAVYICPTLWKGHFGIGKVYAALNDHEEAINSFEQALVLAPTNNKIQKALDESRQILGRQLRLEHLEPKLSPRSIPEQLNELQQNSGLDPEVVRMNYRLFEKIDPSIADVMKGHQYEHGDIDVKQDYEQAAKYFAKAANQGNAEGMYNLARLTDLGLGVEKDCNLAQTLLEQAAAQSSQHPLLEELPNNGVALAEHALGLRYAEGVVVYKNLLLAAYWYQRAVDHGCGEAANNLAIMYEDGIGVDKNLVKAEQLYEMSARKGNSPAMLSLAHLLLDKNEFQMAKIWYDRACEVGSIPAQVNRDVFEKKLRAKQQLIEQCSPDELKVINVETNVLDSLKAKKTMYKQCDQSQIYDYDVLNQYANHGSMTAKQMWDALKHFYQAISILIQTKTLTESQENEFIHELSQCYRIKHIVAQIPGVEMYQKIGDIVDHVLHRCSRELNDAVSQLDEDVRICYAALHMDSKELIAKFLNLCKQKYPKSIFFFELSTSVNALLGNYDIALYEANTGLNIDSNYYELLYCKAAALRLINNDMNETISAYRTFLAVAPEDHPKVPESYYAMASCRFMNLKQNDTTDTIKKIYQEGEEMEKKQLSYFLPYDSGSKNFLKHKLYGESLLNAESAPIVDRKIRLTNSHRIEVISKHREWESHINNLNHSIIPGAYKPRVKQQISKSLTGLKPITLREMNPTRDHIYSGYVLSATIIDVTHSWTPSIHLVIEDEKLDCEPMSIYGFPEEQGEYLTNKVYTIGSKMNIIDPYLRIGASEMKPFIRIDDFSSILMKNESERVINMCRCCGEPNAPHVCSKCKQARYCSKECQTMDWQLYKH